MTLSCAMCPVPKLRAPGQSLRYHVLGVRSAQQSWTMTCITLPCAYIIVCRLSYTLQCYLHIFIPYTFSVAGEGGGDGYCVPVPGQKTKKGIQYWCFLRVQCYMYMLYITILEQRHALGVHGVIIEVR